MPLTGMEDPMIASSMPASRLRPNRNFLATDRFMESSPEHMEAQCEFLDTDQYTHREITMSGEATAGIRARTPRSEQEKAACGKLEDPTDNCHCESQIGKMISISTQRIQAGSVIRLSHDMIRVSDGRPDSTR
jgi:hypothetical protein